MTNGFLGWTSDIRDGIRTLPLIASVGFLFVIILHVQERVLSCINYDLFSRSFIYSLREGMIVPRILDLKSRSGMKTDLTSLDRSVTEKWIHFVFEPSCFFSSTFLFSPPFIHLCTRIRVSCQIVCMSICLSVHSYILFITHQILTVFQSINLYMTAKKINLLHKLICHLIVPYPVDIRQHL